MLCSISPCDFSQNINNLNLCKANSCAIELEKNKIQKMEKQREKSYAYYLKIRELPGYKDKIILAKQQFYEKHKIRIRETARLKYLNNIEFREQKHNTARLTYLDKTAYTPKQKRGRKPLFIDETPTDDEIVTIADTSSLPKNKRGRKPKVIDDTDSALTKIKRVIKKKVIDDTPKKPPIKYLVET